MRFRGGRGPAILGTALAMIVNSPIVDAQAGDRQVAVSNPCTMYFVLGKPPKGLSGFQVFGLTRATPGTSTGPLTGFVMTDRADPDGSSHELRAISLDNRRLKFNSEVRPGLEFRFEGRFLYGGDINRFSGKRIPVVEGTVIKLLKGKKVAGGKMQFYCDARAG